MDANTLKAHVTILHGSINELVGASLRTSDATAQERSDVAISALVSALGEATIGLHVNPDAVVHQLRAQIARLQQ